DSTGLRWGPQWGYAAPAWSVDSPAWPTKPGTAGLARPYLKMWWNPDQTPAADAVVEREAKTLLGATNITRQVEGEPVTIESVRVETHRVEIARGRFEPRECLVVRVAFPPKKLVKVRVEGVTPEGQEHRFYPETGKATALFWPVTEDQARDSLARLSLL